jgi:hypothetical protein
MYRGISGFKEDYKPRNYLLKDENCVPADSHNIFNRWKHLFSQPSDIYKVIAVRQMEIHTDGSLVCEYAPFRVEIVIATFKYIHRQEIIKFRQH